MGKLHGLMIGLDVCSTLHMDVSLDDLGWCIDQIMPANPGYLMALPTRIDPMLGYLTTGYQDHVHIREKFGFRVNDRMWTFFQSLKIVDEARKTNAALWRSIMGLSAVLSKEERCRDEAIIRQELGPVSEEVRSRGVFIAEGYGASPADLQPELAKQIQHIYEDARISIWMSFDDAFVASLPDVKRLRTRSIDRADYILHPVSGEHLSDEAAASMARYRQEVKDEFNTQIVISDGLNALAVMDSGQLHALVTRLRTELAGTEYVLSPINLVVDSGRVRAGYRIGEQLF
jgi:ethanolamine ammonia-lyase large subunit